MRKSVRAKLNTRHDGQTDVGDDDVEGISAKLPQGRLGVSASDDLALFLGQELGGHFTHELIVLNVENFQRGWHLGSAFGYRLGRWRDFTPHPHMAHQCVFCTSHTPGFAAGTQS